MFAWLVYFGFEWGRLRVTGDVHVFVAYWGMHSLRVFLGGEEGVLEFVKFACYCGVQIGTLVDCVLLRRTDWYPC